MAHHGLDDTATESSDLPALSLASLTDDIDITAPSGPFVDGDGE